MEVYHTKQSSRHSIEYHSRRIVEGQTKTFS